LEAARPARDETAGRHALVVLGEEIAPDQHVVLVGSNGRHYEFQMQPGSGPQLEDFGKFDSVLYLTAAEAAM
jgi:hypothetical protein